VRTVRRAQPDILLPIRPVAPIRSLLRRLGIAVGIIVLIALVTWIGRDGYSDADGNGVSLLDSVYYSTVTVTTTGYGDIAPITPGTRAWTTFLVTPLRVLFLIVLVGTTLEVLTERYRVALAENRWRRRVKEHTIVVGYGAKGHGAVDSLIATGTPADQVVVIDAAANVVQEARARGLTVVLGDATRTTVLQQAMVERARAVVVTCNRDDTATLVTLTARELNPRATIVAAVREAENDHLLRESGASTVVVSSEAAGRLLGLATSQPSAVEVLEDLIVAGRGMQLVERPVRTDEIGGPPRTSADELPVAVVRDGERIAFDDERGHVLRTGDIVVTLQRESH
jgi:voltage-gated potassium channel